MTTLHWPCETIWEQLSPLRPDISIEAVAEIGSTNTHLLERARAGDTAACLLVAEHQTAGRGRQGRRWASAPGASLTFSLGLSLTPQSWSGLSLAVGVALADALHPQLALKWPNDLWLRDGPGAGRKLGGILIETSSSGPGPGRYAVIGVGLNVRPVEVPDPRNPVAALAELQPDAAAPDTLARVALPLLTALLRFEREGYTAFAAGFAQRDLLDGVAITTTHADVPVGTAIGVDGHGALRVRTPAGETKTLESGEVSVRPC
ncbi:biotin--[acetyl-CoA-carboxylase] ligase [Caldimonas brevitalea]|uniref:biotin--[biotin carboxyl-carrier protein] ligase n=1 Tax=Caldimonas brevitalea TaxID=413882 RepID=A0A0G3BCD1_9BURK|nr:biotin--[acetyl-CoA-carboxylase] ligase [Caldimonas brevitalea]AKJ27024.1 biotin--acetyl-CoA-carboxylase ligase [Caldimonas brevitalea]